jgi:hypothetical protein
MSSANGASAAAAVPRASGDTDRRPRGQPPDDGRRLRINQADTPRLGASAFVVGRHPPLQEKYVRKVVNRILGNKESAKAGCAPASAGRQRPSDDPRETRAPRRFVAVVSDRGIDCANKDARVRVDTAAMQNWIARVIRESSGIAPSSSAETV